MGRNEESFKERVYWLVSQIPSGQVATYGQIALYAGRPAAARAVGNLMRHSVGDGVRLPWHRVINASGGISGRGEVERAELQRRLLVQEGVTFNRRGICALDVYRWKPEAMFWDEDARDE
jgi:methylated-DNA-protein-cysteine methyltransferase related protein